MPVEYAYIILAVAALVAGILYISTRRRRRKHKKSGPPVRPASPVNQTAGVASTWAPPAAAVRSPSPVAATIVVPQSITEQNASISLKLKGRDIESRLGGCLYRKPQPGLNGDVVAKCGMRFDASWRPHSYSLVRKRTRPSSLPLRAGLRGQAGNQLWLACRQP